MAARRLWRRLGIADALKAAVGARRFSSAVERVLFALVANRALEPCSKLAAAEWASLDVAIPGLAGMDEDQAYRATDLLVDADVADEVQRAVFFAAADLLNLEIDCCCSTRPRRTSSATTRSPTAGCAATATARTTGRTCPRSSAWPSPARASRAGVGLAGQRQRRRRAAAGKDDLRGWRLGRVITVVDRGFSSKQNLDCLRRAGGHWIAGEKMRDGAPDHEAALSRQGRYHSVRDNLRVKQVRLDAHGQRRHIVCHNPVEADRDRARRDDTIARLEAELARIDAARARLAKAKPGARRDREAAAHTRAECALRDHPALGSYLRQLTNGRLRINRAKVTAEARLDGKFLLSTSDPDLSAADVALGYKNLLEAERGIRDLKSTLELRPVFHRLAHRIHAHVLLCWLALLLVRVAERSTQQTWRRIATDLSRLHQVTVAFDAGTVTCTSRLTDAHTGIFRACDVAPPPRITHLDPT